MSSKIDIEINGVKLEVEIDGEAPEPSNGYPGSYEIVAVRVGEIDIYPVLCEIQDPDDVDDMIYAAIDKETEKRMDSNGS